MTNALAMFLERSLWNLFLEILNRALPATWIMLAVILFRLLLKKRIPRGIIMIGWGLVALRLLVPFSVESVLSLIPSARPIPMDIPYADTPALDLGVPVIEKPINTLLADSLSPNIGDSVNPIQLVTAVATLAWLVGMIGLLIYTTVSYVRLRRRVRTATKAAGGEALPLRATLWQCEWVESPFILGILRPRVYLPYGLDGETTALVLSHESAHLKRLDHITKLLAFLVCAVYWFHPLVWVCYILCCRDMEAACDEHVVKDMDDSTRRSYARALLSCEENRPFRPFCPPAFGENDVKSRIKGVLSYKKPLLWVMIVAILVLAVLGVFLLTNPVEKYENYPSDWLYYGISDLRCNVSELKGFDTWIEYLKFETGSRMTEIRVGMRNETGRTVGYGEVFHIYREENGEWVDAAVSDTYFRLPMYLLEHGKTTAITYDVSAYDLATPGNYMLSFTVHAPINEYDATDDFEIRWYFTVDEAAPHLSASPRPADFAIHFESQIGLVPNVLDTFDGYIQKDLVSAVPHKATIKYEPSDVELQYLWYLVEAYGIMNMPSDMHAKQTGDIVMAVTPNTEYVIRVRANGQEFCIQGDYTTCMVDGELNQAFREFVGRISNFMQSTGQWQSLPEAKGGYE